MSDVNGLSTEDRVAIDRVFERLNGRTHYEVLSVAVDASWEAIDQAVRDLRKRMDPTRFVGVPSDEYLRRIEQVLRALDHAIEVLGDPVRRFLYDQQMRRGEGRRGETPAPFRPALTPVPPKAVGGTTRDERGARVTEAQSGAVPLDPPLVVPAPLRKDSPPGPVPGRAPLPRPPHHRPSFVPPAVDGGTAGSAGSVAPPVAPLGAERRDFDALLVEVERIAVSVQFCIAQILDPQASRVPSLQTAGQALADTRATLAAIQARHDEEGGRWAAASANWLRASRAKPQDATLLVRLAECHQRLGDLPMAEDAARRALAIDPNCDPARTLLSALGRR